MAITASEARKNLFPLIEQVNDDRTPIEITSQRGDAVLLARADYEALEETARPGAGAEASSLVPRGPGTGVPGSCCVRRSMPIRPASAATPSRYSVLAPISTQPVVGNSQPGIRYEFEVGCVSDVQECTQMAVRRRTVQGAMSLRRCPAAFVIELYPRR